MIGSEGKRLIVRPKVREMIELLGDEFVLNTLVAKEFAFDWKLQLVTVRVLSSIPRMENYGEEFIRVCMLHGISEKLMTWFRVPLNDRWRQNTMLRIGQVYEEAGLVRYCPCGGLIHMKRGPFGRFEACTKCTWRRKIATVMISEWDSSPSIIQSQPLPINDSREPTDAPNEASQPPIIGDGQ